jgi:long-chain acyl-CoA synthetase
VTTEPHFSPGPWMHSAFEVRCVDSRTRIALRVGERSVSYGELAAHVSALSRELQEAAIGRGDRVVIFMDSCVSYVAALHAVLRIGAVMVPMGAQTKTDKLHHVLEDTGARAMLTQPSLEGVWRPALSTLAQAPRVWALGEAAAPAIHWPAPSELTCPPIDPASPDDLAALIYTSGTTGQPKGVMLSQRNMLAAWKSVQTYLELRRDDIIGLAIPPTFSYGLYHILMGLGLGATVVLESSAAFPVRLLENLARNRVTVFPGVPALWASLLSLDLAKHDLSALRLITNAAAALPATHVEQLRQRLPQAQLFLMYGLTECKRASYLPPEQLATRPTSVGRGLPMQAHWLEDACGQRVPNGGMGELVVQGPHVSAGYWNMEPDAKSRLQPGTIGGDSVLHTGDIFRSDAEGWLYYVGRNDDIFKSRGEKVNPVEVEHAICEMPTVQEAAVVGMPDERLGMVVKAFVKLQPGAELSEREVIRHCMGRLENWMVPKTVAFVDALPLTDSGKLRRHMLR